MMTAYVVSWLALDLRAKDSNSQGCWDQYQYCQMTTKGISLLQIGNFLLQIGNLEVET